MVTESLRILILEDNPADVELVQFELHEAGIIFAAKVVMDEDGYVRAIEDYCPDLILSDYDLPHYNGALALAEARRRCPATPFILVTGAVTEDRAIDILTQGAKDYVLKNRLEQRLGPAVKRALAEAEEHRARKRAEEELREAHRTLEEKVKIRTAELEAEIAAREKTEDALRESDERLRFALETSLIGTWDLDLVDHSAFRSINHDRIFGYQDLLPSWTYEMFLEHVLPEDRMMVDRKFQQAIATHGDWKFECRIRRTGGEVRWIFAAGRHKSDMSGNVRRLAGIVQDITERKQAEEALQLAYNRLQTVFDHRISGIGIIIVTAEGRIRQANDYYLEILGCTRDELLSGNVRWKDFTPPEWLAADEKALARLEECGVAGSTEKEYVRRDGSRVPVLITAAMLPGEEKEVLAFVLDITERKRMEDKLRESEERYRLLAETMLQGVVHQDANGEIVAMNPAAELILGKSREQFLGSSSVDEEHHTIRENGEPFPGMEHPSMVALRTGQPVRGVVMGVFNPKQDAYRWLSIDAVPVFRSADSSPAEVYTVFEDITERKKAAEALQKAYRELEKRVGGRTPRTDKADLPERAPGRDLQ